MSILAVKSNAPFPKVTSDEVSYIWILLACDLVALVLLFVTVHSVVNLLWRVRRSDDDDPGSPPVEVLRRGSVGVVDESSFIFLWLILCHATTEFVFTCLFAAMLLTVALTGAMSLEFCITMSFFNHFLQYMAMITLSLLAYQRRRLIVDGEPLRLIDVQRAYVACFALSVFVAAFPLISPVLGTTSLSPGGLICYSTPELSVFQFLTFGYICCCFGYMAYAYVSIYVHISRAADTLAASLGGAPRSQVRHV